MQAEKMMLVENKIKFCESVEICSWQSYVWQFNTKGLDARFLSSVYSMSAVCIANNKDRLVRDFDYTVARDANNLDSVDVLARNVVEKTLSRIGAKTLSTQKASVIFSSEMSRLLFGYLAKSISGDRVYKESSFLADFLYEKILPEFISIEQSPHLDSTIGSLAFDADGAATSNRLFVKSGVLNSFILGGLSSRRLGFDTTANAGGIQTWLVKDDRDISFKDILSSMGDGLYVTEMMGSGVDLTNGDFSQGVFGYWVENGVVSYPVHEITIAGNLKDMFNGCMGISNDVNKNGTIQVGSMLVDNMVIAGNS
jgi:PmbA protein